MSRSALSKTVLATEPSVADGMAVEQTPSRRQTMRPGGAGTRLRLAGAAVGWLWRLLVGVSFCLNYFASILVVGWTFRLVQGRVLRGWWKQSRWSMEGSFEDFCATLAANAPVTRPRWFLQERVALSLAQQGPDGRRPGRLRKLSRLLATPWFSLWLNLKIGIQALFCTYLLTGWGCLFMWGSWEFGWLNSFNKGYEQAWIGPATGFLGIFLFVAAMVYVPMAQVHQAVTGDYRAFFDFRFVWRLIHARPLAYAGLAALVGLAALIVEGLKTAPLFFDGFIPTWTNAGDGELYLLYRRYLFFCCCFLFPVLLVLRLLAGRIYRFAVLQMLRQGWVAEDELHPVLSDWLDRLGLKPPLPTQSPALRWGTGSPAWWLVGAVDLAVFALATVLLGVGNPAAFLVIVAVWVGHWILLGLFALMRKAGMRRYLRFTSRRIAFGLLFWLWFGFIAKVYVGEFLNYHPFVGFMNHPLVQLPCFDYVPGELRKSAPPLIGRAELPAFVSFAKFPAAAASRPDGNKEQAPSFDQAANRLDL